MESPKATVVPIPNRPCFRRSDHPIAIALASLLIAMALPSPVLGAADAEEAAPEGSARATRRVAWTDIVSMVDRHPRLSAQAFRMRARRAAVEEAATMPNPSLAGSVAYGRARDGSASALEWGLGLSIPLHWLARRGSRIDQAEAEVTFSMAQSAKLRRDVLQTLRLLFWKLAFEQERVAALEQLDEQLKQLQTVVGKRVKTGESRPIEVIRLEVEAEKLLGELAVARSSLVARGQQLGIWLRLPAGEVPRAAAKLNVMPKLLTERQIRARMGSAHPSIAAASARLQSLSAAVDVERGARVPEVALEAFTDHELDRRAYGVGVSVELPIWNWNGAGIERAEAERAAGQRELEAERLSLELTAVDANARCHAAVAQAKRYEERILPRAEAVSRTIETTYELGEAALIEVIDARRTLLETRRQSLSALVGAHTECSRLSALVGEESQ